MKLPESGNHKRRFNFFVLLRACVLGAIITGKRNFQCTRRLFPDGC